MSGKFIFLYSECVHSKAGWEYIGNRRTTKYGLECQRWDQQSPHNHGYQSLGNQENFCRNLDKDREEEAGPWCFTVDPGTRWQSCGIPLCCKCLQHIVSVYIWEDNFEFLKKFFCWGNLIFRCFFSLFSTTGFYSP